MVGRSVAELIGRNWASITDQRDVGGDLASVDAIQDGRITHYTMSKSYVHKRGHLIKVELTVRRFPQSPLKDMICFSVESPPAQATRPELDAMHDEVMRSVNELRQRVEKFEHGVNVQVGDNWREGDKVGNDKITNSDRMIKSLAFVLIVIALLMSWLMYHVIQSKSHQTKSTQDSVAVIRHE
jgi:hypothetical protein